MLSLFILYFLVISDKYVESRYYLVSTPRQLRDYLRVVSAGDTIQLRDGLYSGNFVVNRNGRTGLPIRIVGSQRAIISNNRGTALLVTTQYVSFIGFTISNSRKGIVLQNADNNLIERLIIRDIDEEGISIRLDSTDNIIRNCFITKTGRRLPNSGYGISIGSNGVTAYGGYVDRSNRNSIINNRFQTGSTAEAIRVFEGTCCGLIRDNYFDGRPVIPTNTNNGNNIITGNSVNDIRLYNRCWVTVSGNNYRIERNIGRNSASDGFQVRISGIYDNYGYSNGFSNGYSNGNSNGYSNGNSNGYSNGNINGNLNGNSNLYSNGNSNGYSNGNSNDNSNGNTNRYWNRNPNNLSNGNTNGVSTTNTNNQNSNSKQFSDRVVNTYRNTNDYDYNSDYDTYSTQGCNNVFRANRCEFNTNGYCIRVYNPNRCQVYIYADNMVVGRTALTNVGVTNL